MNLKLKTIAGQPSWTIAVDNVELSVTRLGGHIAPVTFRCGGAKAIQPYHISPWQEEKLKIGEPVLVPLRGDFFCLPFGGGSDGRKNYYCHGTPAYDKWNLADMEQAKDMARLQLKMNCADSGGRVTKNLTLKKGHNVVYSSNVLEGFNGKFPLGHHATLAMPEELESATLSTSALAFGLTFPTPCGNPGAGEYYSLQVNKKFQRLDKVPTVWKDQPFADCTKYPRAKGFCDVFGVLSKPGLKTPAWCVLAFPQLGYAWFSLKDSSVLPGLTIWSENHGRWNFPWNGRNNCLGLEDTVSYLATGLNPSVKPNPASKAGIPTAMTLTPKKTVAINYIQGVFPISKGFNRVLSAQFEKDAVKFTADNKQTVKVPVSHEFLFSGKVG